MLREGQVKVRHIATLDPKKEYFNLPKSDILIEATTGTVLIPYYPDGKNKKYKRVKGIWAALRQQDHIITDSYGLGWKKLKGEIEEILLMIPELKKARTAIEKEKSSSHNSPARQTFNRIAHKLMRKINHLKIEAGDKLLKAAQPLDSLGRRNPSAKMAQVTAAINRLEERLLDILTIIKRIEYREKIILEDLILIREFFFDSLKRITVQSTKEELLEIRDAMLRIYSQPYREKILDVAERIDDLNQNEILLCKILSVRHKIIDLIYTLE